VNCFWPDLLPAPSDVINDNERGVTDFGAGTVGD